MKKILLLLIILFFSPINIAHSETISGIGVYFLKEPYNHKTIIYNTVPNSPASIIPVGYEIIKINNERTKPLTRAEILSRLNGEEGTSVTLLTKDTSNKKHEFILTRAKITIPEKKVNKKFEIHWQQVAPEAYQNVVIDPSKIRRKLSSSYMIKQGNAMQYWLNRKVGFTKGYNACLSYPQNEQNNCLMNLVNREINLTSQDKQLQYQIQANQELRDINYNLRYQNYEMQNMNYRWYNRNPIYNRY